MVTSNTYTQSASGTFTVVHARALAANVATDLKRMQRFYDSPSDSRISDFEEELASLLSKGYFKEVKYGFVRKGDFIEPTLHYVVNHYGDIDTVGDDPGKIRPGADISGAHFCSYLTYSAAWSLLTNAQREKFEDGIAIKRSYASEPGVNGYFSSDLVYAAGGRSLNRSSLRSF